MSHKHQMALSPITIGTYQSYYCTQCDYQEPVEWGRINETEPLKCRQCGMHRANEHHPQKLCIHCVLMRPAGITEPSRKRMSYEYTGEDPEFEREYQRDQRKLYAGQSRHMCPDCGRPNALTDEEKRRGYHCSACTRAIEEGF